MPAHRPRLRRRSAWSRARPLLRPRRRPAPEEPLPTKFAALAHYPDIIEPEPRGEPAPAADVTLVGLHPNAGAWRPSSPRMDARGAIPLQRPHHSLRRLRLSRLGHYRATGRN